MKRTGDKFANGAAWQTILSKGSAFSFLFVYQFSARSESKISNLTCKLRGHLTHMPLV